MTAISLCRGFRHGNGLFSQTIQGPKERLDNAQIESDNQITVKFNKNKPARQSKTKRKALVTRPEAPPESVQIKKAKGL
jgi:hypothetical protein